MSDEPKKGGGLELDLDGEFDWDRALAEWEEGIEIVTAPAPADQKPAPSAEAKALPKTEPKAEAKSRPLYQPPVLPKQAPKRGPPKTPLVGNDDFDLKFEETTRVLEHDPLIAEFQAETRASGTSAKIAAAEPAVESDPPMLESEPTRAVENEPTKIGDLDVEIANLLDGLDEDLLGDGDKATIPPMTTVEVTPHDALTAPPPPGPAAEMPDLGADALLPDFDDVISAPLPDEAPALLATPPPQRSPAPSIPPPLPHLRESTAPPPKHAAPAAPLPRVPAPPPPMPKPPVAPPPALPRIPGPPPAGAKGAAWKPPAPSKLGVAPQPRTSLAGLKPKIEERPAAKAEEGRPASVPPAPATPPSAEIVTPPLGNEGEPPLDTVPSHKLEADPRSGSGSAKPSDGEWGLDESQSPGRGAAAPSERAAAPQRSPFPTDPFVNELTVRAPVLELASQRDSGVDGFDELFAETARKSSVPGSEPAVEREIDLSRDSADVIIEEPPSEPAPAAHGAFHEDDATLVGQPDFEGDTLSEATDFDDADAHEVVITDDGDEAAPAAPPEDAGAAVAKRTVKYRKPREETFPLVGRGPEVDAARRELLVALAENAQGPARARLLCAQAELGARLGLGEENEALYAAAHEADPNDLSAMRALRRAAMLGGDVETVARLTEKELKLPLSAEDRVAAVLLLAEIQRQKLGSPQQAEKTLKTALNTRRGTVAVALMLAEVSRMLEKQGDFALAFDRAADAWDDPAAKSALLAWNARAVEQRGLPDRARTIYERALGHAPSIEALVGYARTARAGGDLESAAIAIAFAATLLSTGSLRERFVRYAARMVHLGLGRPADAAIALAESKQAASLRARAEATRTLGDGDLERSALEAWAQAAGGTERAHALVTLAERLIASNDLEGADAALRDANLADSHFALIRLVRELLSRRMGFAARLASSEGDDPGQALALASKLADVADGAHRERELLEAARQGSESPATADVLLFDHRASEGDLPAMLEGLRRQADRASADRKVGSLLVLSEEARRNTDTLAAKLLLREARELLPGDPLVLRALARLLGTDEPIDAAAALLEEAASAPPERGAFAALAAARILVRAGQDPLTSLRRALDLEPQYPAALFALEAIARARGDLEALAEAHEKLAVIGEGPTEKAGHLVRGALLRSQQDRAAARGLLEKARELAPTDPLLDELVLRLADAVSAPDRAALLEKRAADAQGPARRASLLRAAAALEDAEEPARAAELYRRVLETDPDDTIALRSVERAELAANEFARVAERRFEAVKRAETDPRRALALDRLAELDLHARKDASSAVLSFQSILELAPGHLPTLRTLERYYMDQGRDAELADIERGLAKHLGAPEDVNAHLRLATRLVLRAEDATPEAMDADLLGAVGKATADLWFVRHVRVAARAQKQPDAVARAEAAFIAAVNPGAEAALAAAAAAAELRRLESTAKALEVLEGVVSAAPTDSPLAHLGFAEAYAELSQVNGKTRQAADAFEEAAKSARVKSHVAALWYRAASLWLEEGQVDRAIASFSAAADTDSTYKDVFERLRVLFTERGNVEELVRLTERRIAAGGETPMLVSLHGTLAELELARGNRDQAKQALRALLTLDPENGDRLTQLSKLSLEDQDYRGAAECLIRIARVKRDRDDLRDVFYTLGDIYDVRMPDPRRAEAAYRRVLKLVPHDLEAMERLANLYEREGNLPETIEMLALLGQHEVDPDKSRDHRLRLASAHERQGDRRQAENVLEVTRRQAPTDTMVIRTLADFYERQGAKPALSMHLNRAVNDFRHAIETDATDAAAWTGLIEVLVWRGREDAARVVASSAAALGLREVDLRGLVDAAGRAPPIGRGAFHGEVEETLSPPILNRATRSVFRLAADALDKSLPFDLKALRAEKINVRGTTLAEPLAEAASWFGLGDIVVYRTQQAPHVFVPLGASPPSLLVGAGVLERARPEEIRFLALRALKIAEAQLSIAVRSAPGALAVALAGLAHSYDPNYAPRELPRAEIDEMSKRFAKNINRRVRDELMPLVIEMVGTPGFDAGLLGMQASELGDRVALLATGSMPGALGGLLCLAGHGLTDTNAGKRVDAIRSIPEAASLLSFALAEIHFATRERAKTL